MARHAVVAAASLCVILLHVQAADAQYFGRNKVHYAELEFRVLQTEHFDIYYYPEEEAATTHAARMAERWYSRFSRLLGYTFTKRQPIVLYASHPHFSQTNLTPGSPGEGTGGFTERAKVRIAMPFAAGLGDTDHVLGHEIAHAFQIAIAKSVKGDAFALPGWFIEGMAEYLSLGPANAHTMMWVIDAAAHDRMPTLRQLDDPKYFPYRYGHAFWSYLAQRYGDAVIGQVLRSRATGGVLARLREVTGLDAAQLTRDWHASIPVRAVRSGDGGRPAFSNTRSGKLHLGPALSPDGRSLTFFSERDRVSLDLFMADVPSGEITRKLLSTAADPHFESLQYIHSAGAWDGAGRRFAMTAITNGVPALVVIDVAANGRRQEIRVPDVREIYNPSWSPDGGRIVFSGLKGGLSDLFVYSLESGETRQLTADVFADLHPAWSPDGRTIAFATDRFTSDPAELRFGPLRIGLLDLDSGSIRPLLDEASSAKQVNPQWSPDGSVYFVSDRDGISDVYEADVATATLYRVTRASAGVSGITATSPALAVSSQTETLAFTVFRDGQYQIEIADGCGRSGTCEVVARAGDGPPSDAEARDGPDEGDPSAPPVLAHMLASPRDGLPADGSFEVQPYDDRLQLESLSQPYVGASAGGGFGGPVRASVGMTFGDFLRDRQLQTYIRLGTTVDDVAAQLVYVNRRGQWNWGVQGGFVPTRFSGARRAISVDGPLVTREMSHLRYLHQWGGLMARYNIDRSRRIELAAGVRRTGFAWQTARRVIDPAEEKVVSRELHETPAGPSLVMGEALAAFVYDTAVFGATSPILGQRLRVEMQPALGTRTFADVRVDARRYFMPVRPVTIAARLEHVGRYGPGAGDSRLTPLLGGLQTLVRGYDLGLFALTECGRTATQCSLLDELAGSRFALMGLELRAPLVGLFKGELDYGSLPIEAFAFADTGFLWTRQGSGTDRDRFRSVGAGARATVGGAFVMEVAAARPFDRVGAGWTLSLLMRPGW